MKSLSIHSAWHDSPATFASINVSLNGHSLMRPFVHRGGKRQCRRMAHLPSATIFIHHKEKHQFLIIFSMWQADVTRSHGKKLTVNTHCQSLTVKINTFEGFYETLNKDVNSVCFCFFKRKKSPLQYWATLQQNGEFIIFGISSQTKAILRRSCNLFILQCNNFLSFLPCHCIWMSILIVLFLFF